MGFLDSLFGKKKEPAIDVRAELDLMKASMVQNANSLKKDMDQICSLLSEFDRDIAFLKEETVEDKSIAKIEAKLASLEKMIKDLKMICKLTLQNYDALRAADLKLRQLQRIDDLEKLLKEHISTTPELVVSKQEYDDDMHAIRERLDIIESVEPSLMFMKAKKKHESRENK